VKTSCFVCRCSLSRLRIAVRRNLLILTRRLFVNPQLVTSRARKKIPTNFCLRLCRRGNADFTAPTCLSLRTNTSCFESILTNAVYWSLDIHATFCSETLELHIVRAWKVWSWRRNDWLDDLIRMYQNPSCRVRTEFCGNPLMLGISTGWCIKLGHLISVNTHLENLEKSGNCKVVRENAKNQGNP